MNRLLVLIQMLDKGADAALILENILATGRLLEQLDAHARVQKGELAQSLGENVVVKLDMR